MAKPAITVVGLDELRRDLRRVGDVELNDEMKAIHKALAAEIVERAMPKVPQLTGALKGTLRAAGTARDAIGRVGARTAPYATVIHWGWAAHNIKPRPFLQDAAAEIEETVTDRYETAVAKMLNRNVH